MHVALIGMTGCGKSALTVKYVARRFIGEYDPNLEDTYCRQDVLLSQPIVVWLMDTVDGSGRDAMRYLAWADVYIIVYDITSQLSLQYAESTMQQISTHEHHLCARQHKCLLVGNKTDLERYRQVSESDGEKLAKRFGVMFGEISAVDEWERVAALFRRPITALLTDRSKRRSPSPRLCSSDSEIASVEKLLSVNKSAFSMKSSGRCSTFGRRSKSPKGGDVVKIPSSKKSGHKAISVGALLAPFGSYVVLELILVLE
uniref:small monomeric GTPase n=1 Tax=Setaria digitata TaxID=48799 RepID=A0A915Q0M5_9BILA